MTKEQFLAQCDADEASMLREAEWHQIDRQLTALYRAVRAGDDSVRTQQRVTRLEALQAALCGFPEALAG